MSVAEAAIRKRILKSIVTSLTFYLILVGAVFGYWLVGQARLSMADAKLKSIVSELEKQKDKEGSYKLVQNKLGQILTGQDASVGILTIWGEADQMAQDTVSIENLSIDKNKISFSGLTDTSAKLEEFENRIGENENFQNKSWVSLNRDTTGYSYEMQMERNQP